MPEDKKQSKSDAVQALREEMKAMKEKMSELDKNSIDIGRNPSKAMERISNPLLDDLMMLITDKCQPNLEENMHNKGDLEKKETDMNAKIYDEQMRQVSLKQEILDQTFLLEDMGTDIRDIASRVEIVRDRKQRLQD